MAQRRMFSNRIANSARFLQMPTESQLLYFHLNLHADDDGIAESYPIMKMLGISPDAFKVLLAKQYIQQLNEDQVIVITDWLEHNVIRSDRKVDSIYKHLLPGSIKVIEAKPRSDVKDNSKRVGGQSKDGIGKVRLGKVRLGKVRLGKVRLGKVRLGKVSNNNGASPLDEKVPELIKLFETINPSFSKWYGNPTQRKACDRLLKKHGLEQLQRVIGVLPRTNETKYAPTITTPVQLEDKLAQLIAFIKKEQTNNIIL